MRRAVAIGGMLLAAFASTTASRVEAKYDVKLFADPITSYDGTVLHCDGFIPQRPAGDNTTLFPLIIFPNSWSVPQFEYILKSLNLAEGGYVTLEYETRGWYLSGGQIDTAGPKDMKDGSAVIDFALSKAAEWNINTSAIAFAGISYGAGISLLMAGTDARVKAAVAMSGWANLTESLYQYHTPSTSTVHMLLDSAKRLGHPSQQLIDLVADLDAHTNISSVYTFANARSPIRHVDAINARQTPIFLSHNMNDHIFEPQQQLDQFSRITSRKFMLLNQGGHAEPEALGVLDVPNNYIWKQARRFLDEVMLGQASGIFDGPLLQMECGSSIFSSDYIMYEAWPTPSQIGASTFTMGPRGAGTYGTLTQASMSGKKAVAESPAAVRRLRRTGKTPLITKDVSGDIDMISFSTNVPFGEGTGHQEMIDSLGVAITANFTPAMPDVSIAYIGPVISSPVQMCGIPTINITVSSASGQWQLYAMLYDLDPATNKGRWLSSGLYTRWDAVPGATTQISGWQMRAVCQKIDAGHSLALGFVMYDELYGPASTSASIAFTYGDSTIAIPFV
jgi:alpha/beta superfamily hydrolase